MDQQFEVEAWVPGAPGGGYRWLTVWAGRSRVKAWYAFCLSKQNAGAVRLWWQSGEG